MFPLCMTCDMYNFPMLNNEESRNPCMAKSWKQSNACEICCILGVSYNRHLALSLHYRDLAVGLCQCCREIIYAEKQLCCIYLLIYTTCYWAIPVNRHTPPWMSKVDIYPLTDTKIPGQTLFYEFF